MSIGEKVKMLRKRSGLTQSELGQKVGVSYGQICMIERGTRALSLAVAKDMAVVFECKVEDLCE